MDANQQHHHLVRINLHDLFGAVARLAAHHDLALNTLLGGARLKAGGAEQLLAGSLQALRDFCAAIGEDPAEVLPAGSYLLEQLHKSK